MDPLLIWLSHYGYPALFTLLMLGIVGLPIPDETLLVFSGFLISKGRLQPALTFAAGFFGSAVGISVSYLIGLSVGYRFVQRYGKYVHLSSERVLKINLWFHHIGHWLLTIGYFIPGVRHFTALVAGMSRVEYRTFATFAYPGAAIWVASFLTLGYFVGDNWQAAFQMIQRYTLIAAAASVLVVALVWWVYNKVVSQVGSLK